MCKQSAILYLPSIYSPLLLNDFNKTWVCLECSFQPISLIPFLLKQMKRLPLTSMQAGLDSVHIRSEEKEILMIIYARNSKAKSKIDANVLENLKRKMSTVDIKYDSNTNSKITNYSE